MNDFICALRFFDGAGMNLQETYFGDCTSATAGFDWRTVTAVPANRRLIGFSESGLGYDEFGTGFTGDTRYLTDFELIFVDEVLPGGVNVPSS